MQIEKGKFEIPARMNDRMRNSKYASVFREFANSNEQMLKITFDSNKEAMNCYHVIRETIKRHGEFAKLNVLKRKLEIYVVRED